MKPRVPVLVVAGFLGSGKTTLVRRVLAYAQEHGLRAAVVSNEFGALGIDEALLGGGREEFVELAGGCVCCKLSDELVDTLERLRERVDPDLVVIETSGVALPFDTQLNLYRPPVNQWVGDEAVVVVVNAEQAAAFLLKGRSTPAPHPVAAIEPGETDTGDTEPGGTEPGETEPGETDVRLTWETQVSGADLLVLNKIDLVGPVALDHIHHLLAEQNPDAPVIDARYGNVPISVLLPQGPGESPPRRPAEARTHTHEQYAATELTAPADLALMELEAWLYARRGLRMKGFVRTSEGIRIVQGVGRRLELIEPGELAIPDHLVGRVVVIRRVEGTHTHG